jgi:hypothetical protein
VGGRCCGRDDRTLQCGASSIKAQSRNLSFNRIESTRRSKLIAGNGSSVRLSENDARALGPEYPDRGALL